MSESSVRQTQRFGVTAMARAYPASDIRKMFAMAQGRPDVVKLTVGEPDFPTPEHVKEAGIAAIRDGDTGYVANAGLIELRDALAAKYSARWSRELRAENVVVTVGAMEALTLALDTVVAPGEDVLVPDPAFPNYRGQLHRLGARAVPVEVREEEGFKLRASDVAAALTERTSAIILNSPSNPLGSVMDAEDIIEIARLAEVHGFIVISDEVYDELVFDGARNTSIAEAAPGFDRFLVVNSFSKAYAMTGWRCGFVIGPAALVAPIPLIQEGVASCLPGFIQRAALAALTGPQDVILQMLGSYQQRRDRILQLLNAISGVHCLKPEGAFYAWANVSALALPSWDLAVDLLETQNVAVTPGSAFGPGGEGYLRLSFASSIEAIEAACERLGLYADARLAR